MIAALAAAVATRAGAEQLLLPGLMGYNAMPALPNQDPVVGPHLEIEVWAATQLSGVVAARDASMTPYFRVAIPFGDVAALEVDGVPLELFQVSSATQARLGARDRAGVTSGDLRVAARFSLADERRGRPALGLRVVVKSTTGKGNESRRFTNTPGYHFDLLAGKDVLARRGVALRAVGKLGFLAWQIADGRQDDAVTFGAGLRGTFAGGASLAAELRGYAGWRGHDRPVVLGLTGGLRTAPRLELRATVDRGLTRDAPPLELRAGVVMSIDPPRLRE